MVHITYKNLTPNICTTTIDLTLKIQTCRVRISRRVRLIQSVKNLLNKQNFTFWHSDITMTLKINVTGMNMNKYSSIKVSAIQRLLRLQTRKCEPNTDHYTTHMVLMRSKMTIFVGNTTFFFWIALWLTLQLSPEAPLIKTALTEGGEVQANLSLQYYHKGKNTIKPT